MQADVLGPDYRVETFSLPPDAEGPVVATLVTLEPAHPTGRAVLHVHGFADYFFHTEYARWWADRGYTFYALDLRKYGRSLREHQTPHYVTDLGEYFAEIDLAWWRITERDGHTQVIASAHSTGGLTLPLWVHERRPASWSGWCSTPRGSTCRARPGCAARRRASRSSGSAPAGRSRRSPAGSTTSTVARCTASTAASGTTTSTGSRCSRAPSTSAGCAPCAEVTPQLHAGLDVACPTLVLSSARSHFA